MTTVTANFLLPPMPIITSSRDEVIMDGDLNDCQYAWYRYLLITDFLLAHVLLLRPSNVLSQHLLPFQRRKQFT